MRLNLLILAVIALGFWQPLYSSVPLVSHKAYYTLSLDRVKPGAKVKDAQGVMIIEIQNLCDGWSVAHKWTLDVYSEGTPSHLEVSTALWESKDGRRFNFHTNMNDGEERTTIQGEAAFPPFQGLPLAGTVRYTLPEKKYELLPAGAFFPVCYLRYLIALGASKEHTSSATVFSGESEEGADNIDAFIATIKPLKSTKRQEDQYGRVKRLFHITSAYYLVRPPQMATEAVEPALKTVQEVWEDGVLETYIIDMGDFLIKGMLNKLELLPKKGC